MKLPSSRRLTADSFTGVDFVFFAGDSAITKKYWKDGAVAGGSIVDMTYALEGESGVVVRGPWGAQLAVRSPKARRFADRRNWI